MTTREFCMGTETWLFSFSRASKVSLVVMCPKRKTFFYTFNLRFLSCNNWESLLSSKTGTSKVGAISKAQKAQSFQNCKREDPSGFLKIQFVTKYQKNVKKCQNCCNLLQSIKKARKIQKKLHSVEKKMKKGTL